MKFQVGPRSDEAGRWTRLARLSRSTCRSSYPVCVSSFFHASNFARLFFLPRISLHRYSSISPLDIYLHFDHLTLQEDVPIATNPRNLFDSKRKKKRRDEKSGARTRRTNYELSYVSNNLLSRAFTVTLINSKKRLLISIYIYIHLKIGERPLLVHRFSKPPPLVTSLLRENRACPNKRGDASPTPPRSTRVPGAENRSHFRGHGVHVREHEGGTRATMGRQKCVDTESRRGRRGIGHSPHPWRERVQQGRRILAGVTESWLATRVAKDHLVRGGVEISLSRWWRWWFLVRKQLWIAD